MERREHKRKKYHATVDFASETRPYQRRIDNISQGGIRIRSRDPIARGTLLTLCFELPNENHMKLFGEVVRSGKAGLGVEFHPSLAKGRLGSLIRLL